MKYAGMPMGMWVLFAGSFQKQLTAVLGYDAATARAITKKAKPQYRQIIRRLPEFEKADRFKMNLVNCAMIGAFILSMPQRPEVDRLTDYYAKSMMTAPIQWFCRKSGKSKFTAKDIAAMKATAALKAADHRRQQQACGRVQTARGVVQPVDAPAPGLRAEGAQCHAHVAGPPAGGNEFVDVANAARQRARGAGGVEDLPVVAARQAPRQPCRRS